MTVQAYAISANLASIPIFSILMRYNLIESKLVGRKATVLAEALRVRVMQRSLQVAGAAAVLVPFGVSVLLYTGEGTEFSSCAVP